MSRRRHTLFEVLREEPRVRPDLARSPGQRRAGKSEPLAEAEVRVRPAFALTVIALVLGLGCLLGYVASRSSRPAPGLDVRTSRQAPEAAYRIVARTYRWGEQATKSDIRRKVDQAKDDRAFLIEHGYEANVVGIVRKRLLKVCVGDSRTRAELQRTCEDLRSLADRTGSLRFPDAFVDRFIVKNG